ncbi:VWA domain-containing protein [Vulgatibacter sp.]|uniref:VWA domain-containing protein n=1 Tax=Vulgatibacter sp. TaxID=1971226 RepID=UPI00356A7BAD
MELLGLELTRPWALLLLLAVPLVIAAAVRERRRRAALTLPTLPALLQVGRGRLARFHWIPTALRCAAIAACTLALAGPVEAGPAGRDLSVEGIDIVVALDLSTSMNAVDFRPNDRLHAARTVLDDFIGKRPNDRLGLVVFAGEAYTQCPLTLDHGVLRDILAQVKTGAIADGTAIGNALATSLNRLRDSDAKSKVVILITDGDSNAGNVSPGEAAQMARELGVQVHPIMVGRECGPGEDCRVPFPAGTDLFGRPAYRHVEIPVNPALLRQIASTTGGSFHVATDTASLETGLQNVLSRLEKTRIVEARQFSNVTEVFELFLLPAFLLGLFEVGLAASRFRRFP